MSQPSYNHTPSYFMRLVQRSSEIQRRCDELEALNKELEADLASVREDFERLLRSPCPQCGQEQ